MLNFLAKICRTLRLLEIKNAISIHWQDPVGSYDNLQDLLMIM